MAPLAFLAPRPQAMELRLQIAAVFAGDRPSALDQGGLEPGRAFARATGSPLAGALVILGTETGPGDQMSSGGETAHVAADLGADDLGAQIADPRNGGQQQDRRAKGLDMDVDLPIDPSIAASRASICGRCSGSR